MPMIDSMPVTRLSMFTYFYQEDNTYSYIINNDKVIAKNIGNNDQLHFSMWSSWVVTVILNFTTPENQFFSKIESCWNFKMAHVL